MAISSKSAEVEELAHTRSSNDRFRVSSMSAVGCERERLCSRR